jgi:hypothetical protein
VGPYLEKLFTKIGLVEWLKMKALNSSPSTAKKKATTTKKNPNVSLGYTWILKSISSLCVAVTKIP